MRKESSQKFENKEIFDFDEFLSNNQFPNLHLLERFLKDIFRELSNTNECISPETFREFINLPSYTADKIFKVFDKADTKSLNSKAFLDGMLKLYNGDFQTLIKFIFDYYDFDKDGNIEYDDVNQIQLLILPSQHHSVEVFKFIKDSLDSFFEEYKHMSYEIFVEITENFNSDFFMNLLIYLYTNKPFSNEIISYYNYDKRLGEEANLADGRSAFNCNKDSDLKKLGLKKVQTECNLYEKRKSFSISNQYNP
jgi:Ca2+-binding EF-hand superfamily protein